MAILLLLCLLALAAAAVSRLVGDPPQPADFAPGGIWVQANSAGKPSKNYRLPHPSPWPIVIEMTQGPPLSSSMRQHYGQRLAVAGERLEWSVSQGEISGISIGWIPAAQRMALALPLHPDRMSELDWQALPGIGPSLAHRIETYRHENGDFGCLEGLQQVRGIGPKLISNWRPFFSRCEVFEN